MFVIGLLKGQLGWSSWNPSLSWPPVTVLSRPNLYRSIGPLPLGESWGKPHPIHHILNTLGTSTPSERKGFRGLKRIRPPPPLQLSRCCNTFSHKNLQLAPVILHIYLLSDSHLLHTTRHLFFLSSVLLPLPSRYMWPDKRHVRLLIFSLAGKLGIKYIFTCSGPRPQ